MRGQGKGMKAATPDSGRRVQPRQPMRRPAATGQEAAGHGGAGRRRSVMPPRQS